VESARVIIKISASVQLCNPGIPFGGNSHARDQRGSPLISFTPRPPSPKAGGTAAPGGRTLLCPRVHISSLPQPGRFVKKFAGKRGPRRADGAVSALIRFSAPFVALWHPLRTALPPQSVDNRTNDVRARGHAPLHPTSLHPPGVGVGLALPAGQRPATRGRQAVPLRRLPLSRDWGTGFSVE
jgi:hypothetical protein